MNPTSVRILRGQLDHRFPKQKPAIRSLIDFCEQLELVDAADMAELSEWLLYQPDTAAASFWDSWKSLDLDRGKSASGKQAAELFVLGIIGYNTPAPAPIQKTSIFVRIVGWIPEFLENLGIHFHFRSFRRT